MDICFSFMLGCTQIASQDPPTAFIFREHIGSTSTSTSRTFVVLAFLVIFQ